MTQRQKVPPGMISLMNELISEREKVWVFYFYFASYSTKQHFSNKTKPHMFGTVMYCGKIIISLHFFLIHAAWLIVYWCSECFSLFPAIWQCHLVGIWFPAIKQSHLVGIWFPAIKQSHLVGIWFPAIKQSHLVGIWFPAIWQSHLVGNMGIRVSFGGNLVFLLSFLTLTLDGIDSDLFIIFLKSGKILTGLGELSFFHTLSNVPVDSRKYHKFWWFGRWKQWVNVWENQIPENIKEVFLQALQWA